MSQQGKKTAQVRPRGSSASARRPAGIQSMDRKLYELIQQAVRKMACAPQLKAQAPG